MNFFLGLQVNPQWHLLALVMGWIVTIFVGVLAAWILFLILTRKIDLSQLISEPTGQASLSRFQFLVFTFVISLSLFLIIVGKTPPEFPNIPGGILALLGISGGSYVVAKGIAVGGKDPGEPPPPV